MNSLPVSALILTLNSAQTIERCLSSVSFLQEIVVIDGISSDQTKSICESEGKPWANKVRFIHRKWDNFRDQRNFGLDQISHDWVFVIDSDEACSTQLQKKLQSLFLDGEPENRYYKIKRAEYFLGERIYYGIWNPSYQDRLFRKEGIRYVNEVHEYPPYPETPIRIEEPIEHWPGFGPQQFLEKMVKYTRIEAKDRYDRGKRTNFFRMFMAFFAMFFKNYFYYRSYKDGMMGFVISVLEGVSRSVRHVRIWELQRNEKQRSVL